MKAKAVSFEGENFVLHVAKGCYTLRLRDDDMGVGPIVLTTSSRREFLGTLSSMQDELHEYEWEAERGYGVIKDIDPESYVLPEDKGEKNDG